jgi:hypothetical protein
VNFKEATSWRKDCDIIENLHHLMARKTQAQANKKGPLFTGLHAF